MLLPGPRTGLGGVPRASALELAKRPRGPVEIAEEQPRGSASRVGMGRGGREAGREQIEDGGTGPPLPRNEAEAVGAKPAVGREVCVGVCVSGVVVSVNLRLGQEVASERKEQTEARLEASEARPLRAGRGQHAAAAGTAAVAYVAGEAGRRLHSPQLRVLETCGFCWSLRSPPLPHLT